MGLILDFFTRNFPDDDQYVDAVEAALDDHLIAFQPKCEPTILDRSASVVQDFLTHAKAEKARLEVEIANRQELLRQTNVAIEAFSPVLAKLDEGYDPVVDAAKSYDAAVDAKKRRGDKHFRKPQLAAAE